MDLAISLRYAATDPEHQGRAFFEEAADEVERLQAEIMRLGLIVAKLEVEIEQCFDPIHRVNQQQDSSSR